MHIHRVTMNLPVELIDRVREEGGVKTRTEAVILALEDYLKARKVESILASAGKLEFAAETAEARHER